MRILRDGVSLAHEDRGQGDPALLLVHGLGTDRMVWKPLLERAPIPRRSLAVDLRGFGDSDGPEPHRLIEGHTDDLAFLMQELGLESVIVVGHSMGGMVALDFASRYPAQTSAAVILESMVVSPEPVLDGLRAMLATFRTDGYRDFGARLMTHLSGPHFDPTERERLVERFTSYPQHILVSAIEGMLRFDSPAAAARVRCPLLFVGTDTPYTDLDRFRALCPQLASERIAGVGHYFPIEAPGPLGQILSRFVQSVARTA